MGMRTTDALKQPDSIANFNLPNFLTVVRILLIPVFVILFSDPTPDRSLAAAVVFVVAAVTDLLDGYLARRHSQITRLGRLLDPIADKLLVLSGLILLVQFDRVAAIVAILIIAREVAVTGVRAISSAQGIILEAETTGKYKMVVQVVAIVFLLLEDGSLPVSWHPHEVGTGLLYVALALALYSGQRYLVSFWQQSSTKGL
ncbi:MAG: CDP-diacylglycerol--glycerol-3-phosphate 3-phosphatidyltransferase [Nitrospiraceae bacterium]|nr:CDP-diacylglycerol--glycerol-3-phosphate 3-phosphatidyltransferase [Nitrospiraceae bacterium]MSR24936.1 CDP-diacylglycerol--glycerol-3-phosphate 3-phosphatidyltransferase [Nitrospiraceae bacterium]